MNAKRSVFRYTVAMLVLSLGAIGVFADTIHLKDGSIIKGKIVRFNGGTFSVEIGDGSRKRQMSFTSDEVESIQFDSPSTQAVARTNSPSSENKIVKVSTKIQPVSSEPEVITTDSTPASAKIIPVATRSNPSASGSPSTPKPVVKTSAPKTVPAGEPVELNVSVLADNTANGWTNSGWVVRKGQRIKISGDGEISLGNGKKTGPGGLADLDDDQKLLKAVPTGALIAVIGDDNNDFIYVGGSREFTATRDGTLFLGVNDGNLNDNSGAFAVKIQIVGN